MLHALSPVTFWITAEVAAVVWLLAAIRRDQPRMQWLAKPLASTIFVVLGLTRADFGSTFDICLVVGLLLGWAGDILLIDSRTFRWGLLTFLGGHVAYIAAFDRAGSWSTWSIAVLLPLIVTAAAVAVWLWPHSKEMRGAVSAYILVISVMAWGGIALSTSGQLPIIAGIGAFLFFFSDLAVARHRFVKASFINRAAGLPTYYAAQMLLALTVGST